jgi:threonine dehydrogenase-like Zn-dependent dehydrogenase
MNAATATMRALRVVNSHLSFHNDLPVPRPGFGEVLLRPRITGICGTDLELLRGYYSFDGVPGHEFVADVIEGAPEWLGKRVVCEINIGCGRCDFCRRGIKEHCEQRQVIGIRGRDGAFAQYLTAPVANLHSVPDSISDEEAAFVEPLAAALQVQQQVVIDRHHRVLVLGAGKLGQLVVRTLLPIGCEVVVSARSGARMFAVEKLGVRACFTDELPAKYFDTVIECTGNAAGFEHALRAIRGQGALILKSTYASSLTIDASSIVVNELRVLGSRCGDFALALQWLAERRVDLSGLITARFPLSRGIEAFAHARLPDQFKVLVDCRS